MKRSISKRDLIVGGVQTVQRVAFIIAVANMIGKDYETAAKAGVVAGSMGFVESMLHQGDGK